MTTHKDGRKSKLFEVLLRPIKRRRSVKEQIKPLHTVRSHFSLAEIRGAKFPGCQSAATSLCALLQTTSLCPSNWSSEVIHRLLLQGDKLHSTRLVHLTGRKSRPETGTLTPEQLPTYITSHHTEFTIHFKNVSMDKACVPRVGLTGPENNLQLRSTGLQKILNRWLIDEHAGILLSCDSVTFAVFTVNNHYYLFYPNMKVEKRFSGKKEGAWLMTFRDIDQMCVYICQRILSETVRYELVVVDIMAEFSKWTHYASTLSKHGDFSFS